MCVCEVTGYRNKNNHFSTSYLGLINFYNIRKILLFITTYLLYIYTRTQIHVSASLIVIVNMNKLCLLSFMQLQSVNQQLPRVCIHTVSISRRRLLRYCIQPCSKSWRFGSSYIQPWVCVDAFFPFPVEQVLSNHLDWIPSSLSLSAIKRSASQILITNPSLLTRLFRLNSTVCKHPPTKGIEQHRRHVGVLGT